MNPWESFRVHNCDWNSTEKMVFSIMFDSKLDFVEVTLPISSLVGSSYNELVIMSEF